MAYKYVNDNGLKAYTKKVKGALKDLHTPIAISTDDSPESKAQNVKNIADFVAKAKAAGITNVYGMAVTCLINNEYSGVGYFVTDVIISGVLTTDELGSADIFVVENGNYAQHGIVLANIPDQITSSLLTKGARKPIILTQGTTEVDEETYQKLLSDDVDVVFKSSDGEYCVLTYKVNNTTTLDFYFTCFSCEDIDIDSIYLYAYWVGIVKNAPHTCNINEHYNAATLSELVDEAGFLNKSTLTPVLQEIDLTCTDAERKAKLAQFETDWKNLTGASYMNGARFVGYHDNDGDEFAGVFTYNAPEGVFYSIVTTTHKNTLSVSLDPDSGSLTITPLFSHLGPVEIFMDNSAASKQKNLDNLNAYKANLEQLGVDTSRSFQVPYVIGIGDYMGSLYYAKDENKYVGIGFEEDTMEVSNIQIQPDGEYLGTYLALDENAQQAKTLAQAVKAFGAIKLKASDNAANKAALTAYLKILTDAEVSTTNGYSVPVRITGNAQEYHGMLNIGTGALLSGIVTDVNENHHYPFNVSTADGVITFDANNYFLEKTSNEVTEMLDAIKYSYTPVPLTATTLSNKAQLEVFLSKVPNAQVMHCTYKDVYAGTLHKINGDWFGLLVKNTNNYEDALQVKLQADGTLIEGTTSLAQVNSKLDTIIG